MKQPFYNEILKELNAYLTREENRFPREEVLTIDLHCHDRNSDTPDELLGRILGVPETWLDSKELIDTLSRHGCDTFTVTNHNNARSCYELREKGIDALTGAEFSCTVPDYGIGIHVLTYGFTPAQEESLYRLRSDLYRFLDFTAEHDIPTIWAHPLYHYRSGRVPLEFFDKMALMFERFEVINGQRDSWQNMLVRKWLETLTEQRIEELSEKFGIRPDRYCRQPYRKTAAGGSDSHMGIFAGLSGARLYVPDLKEKLKLMTRSMAALEAIKKGNMSPFGSHNESGKMTVAFLDYFCQIGLHMKDPGLLRMLLHKGDAKEKLTAFMLANGFSELQRHKLTMSFLKLFHECFAGNVPGFTKRLMVPRVYKNTFALAGRIAEARRDAPEQALATFEDSIRKIYDELSGILIERLNGKLDEMVKQGKAKSIDPSCLIEQIELPSNIRSLFGGGREGAQSGRGAFDLNGFLDGLSFPFLAAAVILGAHFTSANVLYKARPLLREFSEKINYLPHPKRVLWMTDTLDDGNGVAMVLKSMLAEVRKYDLPIDFLVCSPKLESGDHLIVVSPAAEYTPPFYEQQPIRLPNVLDVHRAFRDGEYDRIVCSTEGPMGMLALYLKQAYTVPAYFYAHTDWMMFARTVLNFDGHNLARMRRLLRAFYGAFDGLFVLNSDQRKWLTGSSMGFDASKVFQTAHWADEGFTPRPAGKDKIFGLKNNEPVVLFAGRVSEEKGVMELPQLYQKLRSKIPGVKIAVAGRGPCEQELRAAMPEGIFLGWVDHDELPGVYSAADLLVLPSRFDTFGCVVLEALSCGIPVVAYNTKGPKDIIVHGETGFLVKNRGEMAEVISKLLRDEKRIKSFRRAALKRAEDYSVAKILPRFLDDIGLPAEAALCRESRDRKKSAG
jgi:glycosyltransferase involved in cell wall biosynthesis